RALLCPPSFPTRRSSDLSSGVGLYPLAALGGLGIVDLFQAYGFGVLTPEISSALGIGKGAIAGILAVKTLAVTFAPLPFAAVVQDRKSTRLNSSHEWISY